MRNFKAASEQGKIYVHPTQRSLSVLPLKSDACTFWLPVLMVKMCLLFLKEFPLQSLRAHELTCLLSSHLSVDDTDDVKEEDSLLSILNLSSAMTIIQKVT